MAPKKRAASKVFEATSILEAFDEVVSRSAVRRRLTVQSLRPRDAAFFPVIVKETEEENKGAWRLLNRAPVQSMAAASTTLRFLQEMALPALVNNPTSEAILDAVAVYRKDLVGAGAGAGGSFQTEVNLFADKLAKYDDDARAPTLFSPDGALRDHAERLIEEVKRIQWTTWTISGSGPAAPPPAAAEEAVAVKPAAGGEELAAVVEEPAAGGEEEPAAVVEVPAEAAVAPAPAPAPAAAEEAAAREKDA